MIELLEGRGMCPGEDNGPPGYEYWAIHIWQAIYSASFARRKYTCQLYHLRYGPTKERDEFLHELQESGNYIDFKLQPNITDFNPIDFPISLHRDLLSKALKTTASVRDGARSVINPLHVDALDDKRHWKLKKGEERLSNHRPELFKPYTSETVSTRRDRLAKALCGVCGTPHGLRACDACKKIHYCGRDHQRYDFRTSATI